ncbi:MAG: hypothetical protein HPY52_10845 [Firmicutes bacterium]|nr:hypothetical protein [Bacillota bacterium]
MKSSIIAIIVLVLCLTMAMPAWAGEGQFFYGLGERHPMEVEMDWACFSFLLFGDNHTIPSPGPDISIQPIDVSQWATELAYRHGIGVLGIEAGVRNISHKQTGVIKQWDEEKGEWALVTVTIKDESYIRPFGALEIASGFGQFELKGRAGISQDGADFKGSLGWRITDHATITAGYRYWPMDAWYQGPFVGFSATW